MIRSLKVDHHKEKSNSNRDLEEDNEDHSKIRSIHIEEMSSICGLSKNPSERNSPIGKKNPLSFLRKDNKTPSILMRRKSE